MVIEKISCPKHVDKTPSLYLYDSGWGHCFSCGWNIPINQLPGFKNYAAPGESKEEEIEKYVEDVQSSIRRIEALPRVPVRGLVLPSDGVSFYIVFPGRDYYRRRFHNPLPGHGKYRSPTGVPRPAFVLQGGRDSRTAIVVEGEINALSLKAVCPDLTVCCPGGAGDFERAGALYRETLRGYKRVVAIADKDAAGARACLALVGELWPQRLELQLWDKDANEQLQEGTLRGQVEAALGLSRGAAMCELG